MPKKEQRKKKGPPFFLPPPKTQAFETVTEGLKVDFQQLVDTLGKMSDASKQIEELFEKRCTR